MSSYPAIAIHPKTEEEAPCFYIDDYFGRHKYGVRFKDEEKVYPKEKIKFIKHTDFYELEK